MRWDSLVGRAVAAALGAFVVAPAAAPPAVAADVARGEQLARQWCMNCHLLPGQQTPVAVQGPPSFRDVALGNKTDEQIKLFLMHPHGKMPPLTLSRAEIDALVGYIGTLR